MPPVTNNVQFGADITELENAAKDAIALIAGQQTAIQGLMVTQYEHNVAQNKYNATVKATLDNGKRVVIQLKDENNAWTVHKQKIMEAAKSTDALAEARRKAKEKDTMLKDLQDRADKVRDDAAPPTRTGASPFLGPAALSRIAEATTFKNVLAFGGDQFKEAIDTAKEYQIQISLIRTVSQDAQMSFGQWSKGIKEVSDALGTDLVDTAKAAYDVIQSQVVVGPQTLDFLKTAGQLARTTGTDIKVAADLLSSVIQGFDQSITQAGNTAAIIFKTVELGRIQMNELATTMGRVAPSANVLGIRLEEVAASMATLTRQGIKTSDATTLITNVILKLAKPTESMKALMKSWGFETSEAAIKTLGFAGVLRKLSEATDGGKLGELAELFNELRGLRGAVGLTSAFKDFEKDLEKIDNAEETFTKAQVIRAESSADKLQKFATNVKNVFAEEYGQIGLSIMENIVGPMGSGETAARSFANFILVSTGAVIAGKTAMVAFAGVQNLFNAAALRSAAIEAGNLAVTNLRTSALAQQMTALELNAAAENARTVAMANATVSQSAQRAAMVNSIGSMALLTVAIVGATQVWAAYTDKLAPAAYATETNLARIGEAVKNVTQEKIINVSAKQMKTFEELVKVAFKAPLAAAAEGVGEANKEVERLETLSKGIAEDFSIAYKGYLDSLRGDIKNLNADITKSIENIKKSKKEALGFKDTLDDIIRNTQMKYATEQQKLLLTENNITRLRNEANDLFAKGDDDSVAAARKRYDEIARLITDNFDREQDMRKQAMEEYGKQNPNIGPQTMVVSTIPLQKRLNDLLMERNKNEDTYVSAQEKSVKLKKEEVVAATENARRVEMAAKKLMDFNVFDKGGKLKDDFKTGGKFDEEKTRKALQGLQDELIGLIGSPERADAAMEFYEKMYARIDSIARVANAKTNEELYAQDQNRLLKTQDLFMKQNKEAQDKIGKASASAFGKGQALDMFGSDAASLKDFLEAGPGFQNKWLKVDNIKRSIESDAAKAVAMEEFKKFETAQKRIRENAENVRGQLIPKATDVEAASKQFDVFKDKVKDYIKILGAGVNVDDPSSLGGVLLPGRDGQAPVKFGDIANDMAGQKQLLLDAAKQGAEQDKFINDLFQQVLKFQKDAAVPLLMQFPQFGAEAKSAVEESKSAIDSLKMSIDDAVKSATDLGNRLKELPKGAEGLAGGDGDVAADMADASYYAAGGIMGFPGKPRGTDRIPVWMAPGEFIVNAKDSRKFYSQLVDINSGRTPRYFSGGGMVTNSVGDIHVTVNGADAKSPARIGRAVGIEIRREIKRGNLR